ncbi:MAG: sporulation integral membrane protein YtvI [Firmicutes bacterium]|nr:sporulation integral membrane protein YtvI [Bacillota bacterium]
MPLAVNYRQVALVIALIGLVVFRGPVLSGLLPFLIALVLSSLIDPMVARLQWKLRLPRSLATVLTLATLVIVCGFLLVWALNNLYSELLDLATLLPAYQQTATRVVTDLIAYMDELVQIVPDEVTAYIQDTLDGLSENAMRLVGNLTNRLLGTIAALPGAFVVGIITVLATYFFTTDKEKVNAALLRVAPLRWRPAVAEARDKVLADLAAYLKGQLVLLLISTAIAAAGLILIGSRYWMVLSIVMGMLDVIPVLGPGIIVIPWAGISLFLGNLPQAVQLVGLYAVIFAVRHLLLAKVLGDSVGVHPLLMLFALWAGIVFFGVYGILVGPVLMIVGKALWNAGLIPLAREEGS